MGAPRFELVSTVLGTSDPQGLAAFYRDLLGWVVVQDSPEWVVLRPDGGTTGLAFQREDAHVPPSWPAGPGDVQMQAHLDIAVDHLDQAVSRAESLGASLATHQPQDDVRVLLDPAGHPFCLFVRS
ncbi:MAG: VOC family protein [Nocardioides sp.]